MFLDETTIPCTEWATTEELVEVVFNEALKAASYALSPYN
jgi:hypothetical protein